MSWAHQMFASGWPLAVTLGMVAVRGRLRRRGLRNRLNQCLHELRRPLQVLMLASSANTFSASHLSLATSAAGELDRVVNGPTRRRRDELPAFSGGGKRVSCGVLASEAVSRWRPCAESRGVLISTRVERDDPQLHGDPHRLAGALDNLIANSLQHGGGEIEVRVRTIGVRVLISVRDALPRTVSAARWPWEREGGSQGHGLRIVRATARVHGGRFVLRRSSASTEAVLELPLLRDAGPTTPASALRVVRRDGRSSGGIQAAA